MKNGLDNILRHLDRETAEIILSSDISSDSIKEIVISTGKKITVITGTEKIYLDKKLFTNEIKEIFYSFCEYSVHTYKNEICEGFITCDGGCRIGICGTAIYDNGKITGIKDISSLNIRIPHEIKGIADILTSYFEHGILIIGPPCSGKTTILRDTARIISKKYKTVIVDERMEISGTFRGTAFFDVGQAMVLNGFIKSDGIKIASRSLAPQVIICDEFGDEEDISSAIFAMKSGANIIASIHAFDKKDFISKPFINEILKKGIFSCFVFLDRNFNITEITDKEGLLN